MSQDEFFKRERQYQSILVTGEGDDMKIETSRAERPVIIVPVCGLEIVRLKPWQVS